MSSNGSRRVVDPSPATAAERTDDVTATPAALWNDLPGASSGYMDLRRYMVKGMHPNIAPIPPPAALGAISEVIDVSDGSRDGGDAAEAPWTWADGCQTKKRQKINPDKLALYDRYTQPKDRNKKRLWVTRASHKWMRNELRQWQAANGKPVDALPFENEWFFDKRVEGIDKGFLSKQHSQSVVKSYLKSVVSYAAARAVPFNERSWTPPCPDSDYEESSDAASNPEDVDPAEGDAPSHATEVEDVH